MVLAALFLLSLFIWPLWRITLIAPQYPDGVTMYIYIDKIGGDGPATLQNINILNHYVGMQYIEPESIPELTYFPYIIGAMAGLALLAALVGRWRGFLAWTVVMVLLAIAGLYDFYLWEYDYGHNLSDTAPIKVPGQSYQPPLIGVGKILNFTAISLPHIGGVLAGLAIVAGALASYLGWRNRKSALKVPRAASSLALFALLSLGSCSPQPEPIEFGSDACDYCRMTIVDNQHAAELVTSKGRAYKFDAVECMVPYYQEHQSDTEYAYVLVSDYVQPGSLVDGREATYLISEAIPSPMGGNLSAFLEAEEARAIFREKGGELYTWDELRRHLGR